MPSGDFAFPYGLCVCHVSATALVVILNNSRDAKQVLLYLEATAFHAAYRLTFLVLKGGQGAYGGLLLLGSPGRWSYEQKLDVEEGLRGGGVLLDLC